MEKDLFFNKRPGIFKFAPWAVMNKPFTREKHYIKNNSVCYDVSEDEEYANHIEMSGFYCSAIISYGCEKNGEVRRLNHIVFPSFRMYPNETRSSLDVNFETVLLSCNAKPVCEKAVSFVFDGVLKIITASNELKITRKLFAAPETTAFIELVEVENTGEQSVELGLINNEETSITDAKFGHNGQQYKTFVSVKDEKAVLKPKETACFEIAYCACLPKEELQVNCLEQYRKRQEFLRETAEKFVVTTPDETVNVMAHYAKVRAAESIFKTKSGLMHSPGGGNYYAAMWTNDQCEYINPFFANLGYKTGIDQSFNCYRLYKKYALPDKAVITSIIAGGDDVWHGAGDRGDSAMYAYGCSRFLLALGDVNAANEFIDGIENCLEYAISQINADGVVKSDADELENRFESGNANLCTSCLAYDAFISASYLEKQLGNEENAQRYMKEAEKLKIAIEKYFGKTVEGFDTYMYCKEETNLRSWICMPLVSGIFDRAEDTANALLSEKLCMGEGLVTRSGETTFWDRSTLYALRGLFYSGLSDAAYNLLCHYSKARLLGEHIPYAVEAFPEGNQAQLSAESALYLRIFSEGIMGYRPIGFNRFEIRPNLPSCWNEIEIKNMKLGSLAADIKIARNNGGYKLNINAGEKSISKSVLQNETVIVNI